MAQPKPLFIPWLKEQIDSGRYPGVQWVNQEGTKFSIPWKHALRQDSNSDDILIFKAWAQTSAGTSGQISGDHSVWKRNFRSALRVKGFKIVDDNKNDAANPHKIFMWPENAQSGETGLLSSWMYPDCCNGHPTQNDLISFVKMAYIFRHLIWFSCGITQPDVLDQCLMKLNIVEPQPEIPVDQPLFVIEPVNQPLIGDARFPVQETSPAHATGQVSPAEGTLAHGQYSPLEGAFMLPHQQELPVQATSNDTGSNQFGTHFLVNVYYRGKLVLNQVVENESGFYLMFRQDPSLRSNLSVVELPGTESILDQNQVLSTQEILKNLGGLEVRREGNMLLGYRWGDSRVYWGLDKHEKRTTSRALSKNVPERIYSIKDFVSGLVGFIQDRGLSPSCTLYFFLGQQWPDPKNKPWEKKLIMVEVILTTLERLKEMALANGATSLQSSVDLQISLEQMMEMC
ncbi:interferon regulatory factor 3 isoform X1, partial [Silurus meridionalis]